MDHNEISMCMDVKLDTHDKRAIALRYKTWTRCLVKIEAIKCVPCFLRLSFQSLATDEEPQQQQQQQKLLSVSVNVPGVNISLATSRTKQHSYGLFWTQNRRDCFIYFALETEVACRRHMKWIKKSIKNLELFRQIFLEQRRFSRDTSAQKALRPLPNVPESFCFDLDASNFSFSARVSQIYEEIFDGSRISRASIASGIYEEMNLASVCPSAAVAEKPPVVPPLPAHRKRINTFECQPGEIPRSSTNPESELAKKKKYKNMLDNFFGQKRRSGSASVGELQPSGQAAEEQEEQQQQQLALYENAPTPEPAPAVKRTSNLKNAHRNSFSSPDLSQLNFLDTFGEALSSDELNISLEDSAIEHDSRHVLLAQIAGQLSKADSLASLNVSEQLPHNFNFSACNTSTINLIGANGAVSQIQQRNKNVLVEELNGYCVMAPIAQKKAGGGGSNAAIEKKPSGSTASTTSGYSTGSYCSSTSSCNTDEQAAKTTNVAEPPIAAEAAQNDTSDIYESMHITSLNSNSVLAEHLYENLLAVKASQELEQHPLGLGYGLSTSTPTESPLLPALPPKQQTPTAEKSGQEDEDYYQTPRKSIISVDDKIPSYYPNSCDTVKSKRRSPSSAEAAPGVRHLVSAKLRRERKENLYISSPQQIIEQRHKSSQPASTSSALAKTKKDFNKKTAAHKISEGVYVVTHPTKRASNGISNYNNNNNNNNNDLQAVNVGEEELLQLVMLQNIDFKFDDGQAPEASTSIKSKSKSSQLEDEYEHCYQAAERATRMLQKYATLAKFGNSPTKQQQLQLKAAMTQSQSASNTPNELQQQQLQQLAPPSNSLKKFASLPRFKKIDFSPLKMRLNNVLQRNATPAAPASPQ
ncbi:ras guanine nucleotide exchange factor Y [Drosophila novamexicana]|uniref:ras guanine nucleotide exchange factor Y n=1 Tax=Drosophila novamexicana TaxID=47314 RepID=UPI0011E60199|nr:ras guanine nucleotide exchange factor Y [Drosophila novamexicana]XP_030557495.1 ras guanine nucleotide exchange factor Y [Drosophila novamexicana]